MSARHPELSPGFVPLPRKLFDLLLTSPLTRCELLLALLVVRLTSGCQNAPDVELKLADLALTGVGASHAGECFDRLTERGILKRTGKRRYALAESFSRQTQDEHSTRRINLLINKVVEQLRE